MCVCLCVYVCVLPRVEVSACVCLRVFGEGCTRFLVLEPPHVGVSLSLIRERERERERVKGKQTSFQCLSGSFVR